MSQQQTIKTTTQQLADALHNLMCATEHYGFSDESSESFWESRAESAAAEGKTSDDIRREQWEQARQVYAEAQRSGAID